MRAATWNVNGIRSVVKKGQAPWDVLPEAEILCLQETKAQPVQLPAEIVSPPGWHGHWHSAQKKGYSGVAIFTRQAPDEVIEGLSAPEFDAEGRLLGVRFGDLIVASAYFPNSQDEGRRLPYKLGFCAAIEGYMSAQAELGREVLLMGDFNIAHRPIDLARPKQNEKSAGYLPEERAWMSRYVELGYVDFFRQRYPELTDAYTWWSFRARARERNVGWRLDYASGHPGLSPQVREVTHHTDIVGSDHCPVSIDLDV
jgi:exodeoxyribonuclease III